MMADEWLSLQQIADELGVPLRTLYAQRSKREGVPGYRIGKHVWVRRADLNAWLERQADRPVSA
jgi:excisionase family DNA binding protein